MKRGKEEKTTDRIGLILAYSSIPISILIINTEISEGLIFQNHLIILIGKILARLVAGVGGLIISYCIFKFAEYKWFKHRNSRRLFYTKH